MLLEENKRYVTFLNEITSVLTYTPIHGGNGYYLGSIGKRKGYKWTVDGTIMSYGDQGFNIEREATADEIKKAHEEENHQKFMDSLEPGMEVIIEPSQTQQAQILITQALEGQRGNDQRLIAEVGLAWVSLILRKNHDYGGSVFKAPILRPTLSSLSAIEVRMSDKIQRIETLATKQGEVSDEGIDDTYRDLGAYCLLRAVAKIKESNNEQEKETV